MMINKLDFVHFCSSISERIAGKFLVFPLKNSVCGYEFREALEGRVERYVDIPNKPSREEIEKLFESKPESVLRGTFLVSLLTEEGALGDNVFFQNTDI